MLLLYFINGLLIYVSIGLPSTYGQEDPANSDVSKLEYYLYKKCERVGASSQDFEKIRGDVYEIGQYMPEAFKLLPKQRALFCENERPKLTSQINAAARDLKKCLPEKEMFLAKFLKEVFEEFLHFFCHNNGIYTMKLFVNRSSSCSSDNIVPKLANCFDIFSKPNGYVTKTELCDDMVVSKKCFAKYIEMDCSANQIELKDLNDKFFSFIDKPCTGCVHYFSIFILLVSLLSHLFVK